MFRVRKLWIIGNLKFDSYELETCNVREWKHQTFFLLPIGFCPLIWHWKVTCCPCLAFVTDEGCLTKYKHSLSFIFVDISLVIESTISFCFLLTFPLSIVPPETRPVMLFFRCGKTEYSVYSRSFCWPPSRLG